MDVGVAACAIDMVVDGLTRTALATTSRYVLGTHVGHRGSQATPSHRACWVVHAREPATITGNIRVSTRTICVIDLCTTCTC